jgi:hypothetical protein
MADIAEGQVVSKVILKPIHLTHLEVDIENVSAQTYTTA